MASPAKQEGSGLGSEVDIKLALSQREQETLMAAWLCIKGNEPQVDYEKLAKVLKLKNGHTASTTFYLLKKKINKFRSQADGAEALQSSPPAKVTTPRKRTAGGTPTAPTTPKSGRAGRGAKRIKSEDSAPNTPTDDGGYDGAI
ncbi:hypothetical protein SPI_01961 [Niveomyces insectorum RCEF 264]|uniref:Uncharacterized protein n=1 Tax=Niveomyces insectorum RCEF 264 TaxID=1081102 RepID=A0A167XMX4_9HYPO|nr:hypothetical protein SPI_01961 [Niveomyces insectorum RCEF 264]